MLTSGLNEDEVNEVLRCEIKKLRDFNKQVEDENVESYEHFDAFRLISIAIAATQASPSHVIAVNRILVAILAQIKLVLSRKLRENLAAQNALYEDLKTLNSSKAAKSNAVLAGSFSKCGDPFFKTYNGYLPQKTPTQSLLDALGYVTPESYFENVKCWDSKKNQELRDAVLKWWKRRIIETNQENLLKAVTCGSVKKMQQVRKKLEEDITSVVDVDEVDWTEISCVINDFAPNLCKAQWMYFVNPSLNNSAWAEDETYSLTSLAFAYKLQNWDEIAAKLGSKRSGLQCFIRFVSVEQSAIGKWSENDDDKLISIYNLASSVATRPIVFTLYHFDHYSHMEIMRRIDKKPNLTVQKRSNVLRHFNQKREQLQLNFSCEEDRALIEAHDRFGDNWSLIAEIIPDRNILELRNRLTHLHSFAELAVKTMSGQSPLVPRDPKNVWSLLELLWDGHLTKKSRASKGGNVQKMQWSHLYKMLQFTEVNFLCPSFKLPESPEERASYAKTFALAAHSLQLKFDVDELCGRLNDLSVDDSLRNISCLSEIRHSFEVPRCFVPPNILTLVGFRTLLCEKGNLYGQTSMSLTLAVTNFSPITDPADRLKAVKAKKLFIDRMIALFFMSCLVPKVNITGEMFDTVEEKDEKLHKKKPTTLFKNTYSARRALKKKMSKLTALRWNAAASRQRGKPDDA